MEERNCNGDRAENNENKVNNLPKLSAAGPLTALLLSVLGLVLGALSIDRNLLLSVFVLFAVAVGSLTFIFASLRYKIVCLLPIGAGVVSALFSGNFLLGVIYVSSVVVCSALFALIILRKIDSFKFFMVSMIAFSVFFGLAFVFFMVAVFPSFGEGLVKIGAFVEKVLLSTLEAPEITANFDEKMLTDLRSTFVALAQAVVPMLPGLIFCAGCIAAWITNGTVTALCRLTGKGVSLFKKISAVPTSLAVIFMITTFLSMFVSMSAGAFTFGIINLQTVLTLIFAGVGALEFVSELKNKNSHPTRRIMLAVTALVLFFFAYGFIFLIAAVYGVSRVLSRRLREKLSKREQ